MTRVAIYARYSDDLSKVTSTEDQIRMCEERANREGWSVNLVYTDPEISGEVFFLRPGIQQVLRASQNREFDILLAEGLDRISRDQGDIAGIYKRMKFAEITMVTLAEGVITPMHIGFKGTMNAEYLSDLRIKVKRGQRGNISRGQSAGGLPYGYCVVRKTDEKGNPIRGFREIDPEAAEVVRRIFDAYIDGRSPIAIAKMLNAEGVPGPTGTGWTQSTINGNRRRGIGILNNEIYIGMYVWNRQRFLRNPDTEKRVPRFNPESEWIRAAIPELRIVDQQIWEKAKERQRALPHKKEDFWKGQRPKYLLSGLLKCGVCGSGCAKSNHDRYACYAARTKGTCTNTLRIEQGVVESAVVHALKTHLMDPKLCALFCQEYTAHLNRLRRERNARLSGHQAEMAKLERRRKYIAECIMDGMPGAGFKDEMIAILARKDELAKLVEETPEEKVVVHPNMAHRYRQEVNDLVRSLNNDETKRTTAHDLLRRLVDKVELVPDESGKRLCVNLHGDLAGILTIATKKQHRDEDAEIGVFKLVAEEGFEPPTQGL